MAVVGEAEVIVTVITTQFEKALKDAFKKGRKVAADEGERYGKEFGDRFGAELENRIHRTFANLRPQMAREGEAQGKLFSDAFAKNLGSIPIKIGDVEGTEKIRAQVAKAINQANEDAAATPKKDSAAADAVDAQVEALRLSYSKLAQAQGQALAEDKKRQEQRIELARREAQAHEDLIASLQGQAIAEYRRREQEALDAVADMQGRALEEDKRRAQKEWDDRAVLQGQAIAEYIQRQKDAINEVSDMQSRALDEDKRRAQKAHDELADMQGRALEEDKRRAQKAWDDLAKLQGDAIAEDKRRTAAASKKADRDSRIGRRRGGGVSRFLAEAEAANKAFTKLYAVGNLVSSGLGFVAGGLSSLVSGFFALASAAGQAAGTLVVIPSLLGALGQAGVTAALAFSGVGKAISAGFSQAAAAASGGDKAAETTNQVADAQKALGRAYEDNAKRIRNANRQVADAEGDLVDAQNRAKIAQDGLTAARKRAQEQLEDLAFSVEGAALTEERAILNMQDASKRLAEVQSDPTSTIRDLQEASLSYREADLAVRQSTDSLQDLKEEQAAANQAGVEGSAEVVDAKNDIADANNRVADAAERLAKEEEDRNDVLVQNTRALEDAQTRLARAMGGVAGSADAYQQALAELSPEARKFAEFTVTLKDDIDDLQAAAGQELFPKLTASLGSVSEKFFPAFREALVSTGSALGDFSTSIGETLTGGGFLARFRVISEDNNQTIRRFGDIFGDVINTISGVLVAAGPLVDRFTSWLANIADNTSRFAGSASGIEKMTGFFQRSGDVAAQLGGIFENIWKGLSNIIEAAQPAGQALLDSISEASEKWGEFNSSITRKNELENFFFRAADNAKAVAGLLKDILGLFGDIGGNAAIGKGAEALRANWVPVLGEIIDNVVSSSDSFAELLISVTDVLSAFTDTAGMEIFMDMLKIAADLVDFIVSNPIGSTLLSLAAPAVAIGKAFSVTKSVAEFFFKAATGGFLSMVGTSKTAIGSLKGTEGAIGKVKTKMDQLRMAVQLARNEFLMMGAAAKEAQILAGQFGGTANLSAVEAGASRASKGLASIKGAASVAGAGLMSALGGPVGLAITGVTLAITGLVTVMGNFSQQAKEAEEKAQAYADSLDRTSGSATQATFDVFKENLDENVTDALDRAGVSTERFFLAATSGDLDSLRTELVNAGVATEDLDTIMGSAQSNADGMYWRLLEGAEAAAKNGEAFDEAGNRITFYSDQAALATAIIQDNQYAVDQAAAGVEKLNENYDDLVNNFSTLNDTQVTQERANLRLEQGYDGLSDKLEGVAFSLDATTEAGQINKGAILDQMEVIDNYAQAQLGARDANGDLVYSTEEVQKAYEDNITALVNSIGSTDEAKAAVRAYIDQISLTPTERETRFKAVFEEAQITKLVEGLDNVTAARLVNMRPNMDWESVSDMYNDLAELLKTDVTLPVSPQILAGVGEDLKNDINEILKDDVTGEIRPVELLTETERKSYDEAVALYANLLNNPQSNSDAWIVTFLTEPEQRLYNETKQKMLDLLVDDDGDPLTAMVVPEEDKYQYNQLQATLDALTTDEDGNPRGVEYLTSVDPDSAAATTAELDGIAEQERTAKIKVGVAKEKLRQQSNPWAYYYQASGGPVTGPGGPTADKVGPFMLSNGEFVLSARAVSALGGMRITTAIHEALKKGGSYRAPGMQSGGTVPPSPQGTMVRLGEAGQAERVEPLDANGLSAGDRAILQAIKDAQKGFSVNIGTIQSPRPEASAQQVVAEMRAQSFRMGQLS